MQPAFKKSNTSWCTMTIEQLNWLIFLAAGDAVTAFNFKRSKVNINLVSWLGQRSPNYTQIEVYWYKTISLSYVFDWQNSNRLKNAKIGWLVLGLKNKIFWHFFYAIDYSALIVVGLQNGLIVRHLGPW